MANPSRCHGTAGELPARQRNPGLETGAGSSSYNRRADCSMSYVRGSRCWRRPRRDTTPGARSQPSPMRAPPPPPPPPRSQEAAPEASSGRIELVLSPSRATTRSPGRQAQRCGMTLLHCAAVRHFCTTPVTSECHAAPPTRPAARPRTQRSLLPGAAAAGAGAWPPLTPAASARQAREKPCMRSAPASHKALRSAAARSAGERSAAAVPDASQCHRAWARCRRPASAFTAGACTHRLHP